MIFAPFVKMSGQSGGHKLRLSKLNEQLTCKLCGGYFIDATTIIECLHSFCRSCIVKYLENNKYCPICEVQVHKSKPLLNIRPDYTLQDIVYKLVPGCYQNEMRCRREFYSKHPEERSQVLSPEARGEPIESHIYSPDESLSLSLQYFNPQSKDSSDANITKEAVAKLLPRRYLRCPAAVTVFHLQKLIRAKYGLRDAHRVDIMYKEEPLNGSYTLMDVMYIYHWRRKVPLHLSYRIFESSPKRIKLSEDNVNYKKSLINTGIDYVEAENQQLNREWKEVQLKISEAGVMSITDISNPGLKRSTRIEEVRDQVGLEGIISTVETAHKSETLLTNLSCNKTIEDTTEAILESDMHVIKSSNIFLNLNNSPSTAASDLISETDSTSSLNAACAPIHNSQRVNTEMKTLKHTQDISTTLQVKTVQETDDATLNNNVHTSPSHAEKSPVRVHKTSNPPEESKNETDHINTVNVEGKELPVTNINNNISTGTKAESEKFHVKSDVKTVNTGSKIDALSAKLQFQPKITHINNTYSKKEKKEKKVYLHSDKKLDTKQLEHVQPPMDMKNLLDNHNTKTRTNTTISLSKVTTSQNTIVQQNQTGSSTAQHTSSLISSSGVAVSNVPQDTSEKNTSTQCSQNAAVTVQQALSLLDQRINTSERSSIESTVEVSQLTNANANVKVQQVRNNNNTLLNESPTCLNHNITTPATSQTTLTFPYTVQDIVNTTILKSPQKNSNICSTQKLTSLPVSSESMNISCTPSDNQLCSIPHINMQAPSMSIYSISTTLKNSYSNVTQSTTTTTTTTTTMAARQELSKPNFEISGVYSVPPCPDAIPISLMKPFVRKHEVIAKGTNLNEICAKIGTSGSKINDICAKIGENSKEKNKAEGRNKSDIPDLLKIAKKGTAIVPESTVKHIPNIPNVPIFSPNTNIPTESKNTHITVKDNTNTVPITSTSTSTSVPTSHGSQKISSLKKQNQSSGYKTLRDPPKSWNPTLSKNNYVAVKNQTKEMQSTQSAVSEGTSKHIPSKPAKIFKMKNMPRYLGNPASGVKPMYGITNETKEKEQTSSKGTSLNMMKIDPKTLSPIVSTSNSPIVSPPPYSPNARSYQNTPFSREICRNTNSPISPRNSPVNMLSTNPFIPSPTPNTNPRLIYSHFPPPFPDPSGFPNPLIRSPIGIPPPSAFHSSLPPTINKLYQRTSYIPQTTGYSPVSQPPTVQRIPPSTHSSSPKSPKTSSPSIISTSFNPSKTENTQTSVTTSADNVTVLFPKGVTQQDHNAFNLSKSGTSRNSSSNSAKMCGVDGIDTQNCKQNSTVTSSCTSLTTQSKQNIMNSVTKVKSQQITETRNIGDSIEQKHQDSNNQMNVTLNQKESIHYPNVDCRNNTEANDIHKQMEKQETIVKVNGDITVDHFDNVNKINEHMVDSKKTKESTNQTEANVPKEENDTTKSVSQGNVSIEKTKKAENNESKTDDLGKVNEQVQTNNSDVQKNKVES
ncbi:uncharacterized protein YMR317W-like isoform X1 [Vespa velutina]|uniref:uncharacterized protein YMR317W-like isoform X1 n=2 Tax=Vespa velutina TaxID=202808 RepID=UPI001FB481D6|nr:uncharacterized protein YMR317W-like isoform X1 [Vespa velutina]